jgi:hypothetical protein
MTLLLSIVISFILGGIAAAFTGSEIIFWIVTVFFFVCSIPGLIIDGFMEGIADRVDERASRREALHDFDLDLREMEREDREEERMDRYLDKIDRLDRKYNTYNFYNIDSRSIHYHDHSESRPRDAKGRFLPKKK